MQLLSPKEAQDLWPLMDISDIVGAAFLPTDGQASPSDITQALARGARAGGAKLVENTPVLEILTDRGNMFKTTLKSAVIATALATAPTIALADDMDVVKAFYSDLLTTPADVKLEDVRSVISEDWVTTPAPRNGGTGAEGFYETLKGFGAIIPDLSWEPQEILQDGNRFIVRGRATGTPEGPFFGIDPATGKSFDIMILML